MLSGPGPPSAAVFKLSEPSGEKVRNPKKLHSIKQMLNVWMRQEEDVALNGGEPAAPALPALWDPGEAPFLWLSARAPGQGRGCQ